MASVDRAKIIGMVRPIYNESNTLTHYQRLYYMYDSLGSVSVVTGENGLPLQNYTYSPYGSTMNVEYDPVNNLRFVGRYGGYKDDDTGLTYFWHRWYDEGDGRWGSRDPIKEKIYQSNKLNSCNMQNNWKFDTNTINLYHYTYNRPLIYIDDIGLYCGPGAIGDTALFDYVFGTACKRHDECYGTCGNSKQQCDEQFLQDLITSCRAQSPSKRAECFEKASFYYNLVKIFGDAFYITAQKKACACK